MPLTKGKGKKVIGQNIKELETGPVGPTRDKAIHTIMKKYGITYQEARDRQARAIALSINKSKKK